MVFLIDRTKNKSKSKKAIDCQLNLEQHIYHYTINAIPSGVMWMSEKVEKSGDIIFLRSWSGFGGNLVPLRGSLIY